MLSAGKAPQTSDGLAMSVSAPGAATQGGSPFSSVVSASSGEWADRGARLGLALVIYGFGLGFVARMLRVRV